MAINPININPLDVNPSAAVGIDLPLSAPAVFKPNFTTKDAIKADLINFFLTDPGERPLNPSFGGGIKTFMFEQISQNRLDFLREDIQTKVRQNFPRINIEKLEILQNENTNSIIINFTYSVKNTNISDEIEIII